MNGERAEHRLCGWDGDEAEETWQMSGENGEDEQPGFTVAFNLETCLKSLKYYSLSSSFGSKAQNFDKMIHVLPGSWKIEHPMPFVYYLSEKA
ncbi:hypothetical protein BTVI_100782 [Pitangus sulphuratus]|nr:hypothetical protein BTVI_100782 [Pitangus sulphuratus]